MNKKLILFLTSLSLTVALPFQTAVFASEAAIVPVENRASLKAATGEYRSWKQGDPRWGSMHLGSSSDTMAQSGCLVTAIATLMVHTGCADESTMDPGVLCEYLSNNGGFTAYGELYWAKINGAADGFSLSNWKVMLSGSAADKAATIEDYVSRGYAVVVNVAYGSHWVAVSGVSGSNVSIMDPAYSTTDLFGYYDAAGVDRIAVFSANGSMERPGDGSSNSNVVTSYNATGKVNVGASYLNVRTGAGTDKGYLRDGSGNQVTLQNNAQVSITGKTTDSNGELWYRIAIDGYTGYVYGAYITITSDSGSGSSTEGVPGYVNGTSVNVRSGAGTNNGVLTVANINDEVKVIGEATDGSGDTWYKVEINGVTGFILSDYVTLDSDGSDGSGSYEAKEGTVNATSVNVRTGAGTGNSAITMLTVGDKVKVVGEEKDGAGATWYKIEYSGGSGYIHSDYVTIGSGSGNNGGSYEQKEGYVNGTSVNVRSGAGTNNGIVTVADINDKVTVIGEKKDGAGATWYKVKIGSAEGYILSDYVTIGSSGNSGSGETTYEPKDGAVNASGVNVRSGAGTNNSVVTVVSTGTAVKVTGEAKDSSGAVWYKVTIGSTEGYIHSDYVTIGAAGGSTDSGETMNKKGTVNDDYVYVRTGAGTNNDRITHLNKGTAVTVVGEATDGAGDVWYKIQYSGGTGYMHSDYIDLDGASAGSDGNTSGGTSDNSGNANVDASDAVIGKEAIVNVALVNVRKGVGTDKDIITELSKDVSVLVEGIETDSAGEVWYKVAFSGTSGYMYAKYLNVQY